MNVERQLTALSHLSPAQLREKYLEVFGEPSRSGNKDFLLKRVAWRIQSLAEGGLSERAKQRALELARDADIRNTIPRTPKVNGEGTTKVLPLKLSTDPRLPIPGTILTRSYKGQQINVVVLATGFEYQGQMYRSLTAVAKAVTGTHWNGHLFFGLRNQ